MKVIFLTALFSASSIFAMESQKETGKQPPASSLTLAEKKLLAQQAKICSLMNQKVVTIEGKPDRYASPLATISSSTDYSVSVSDDAHKSCRQLLERFAQSLKEVPAKPKPALCPCSNAGFILSCCEDDC